MDRSQLATFFDAQPDIVDRSQMLEMFGMQVRCAPWPFPDVLKIEYSNVFYRAIFEIIVESGIPKGQITYTTPEEALDINRSGRGHTGWFAIGYDRPGQSFAVTVDDKVFQIRSDGLRLEDLVYLAEKVFSKVTDAWRSDMLATPVHLHDRVFRVDYTFKTRLRLGQHKVQQSPVRNYDLLTEMLSLNRKPSAKGTKSISDTLLTVAVDRYHRIDFHQHATKEIDGHDFIIGLVIEGPLNEENTILEITSFIRTDEEVGFSLDAGLQWDTALVSFYREIVLKRFLANLLCSTEFSYV